jgi:hypothetical protein
MPEPAMRVADVADAIVASYLYRVVARLPHDSQPTQAWFRVTSGSSHITLEMGEATPVIDPNFEVRVVVEDTTPGLLAVLTRASAEMEEPVRVLPSARLASDFSADAHLGAGWKQVAIPQIPEPELLGV